MKSTLSVHKRYSLMAARATKSAWCGKETGNIHGNSIVYEEDSGKDIAICYDEGDAGIIAIEHNSHDALVDALEGIISDQDVHFDSSSPAEDGMFICAYCGRKYYDMPTNYLCALGDCPANIARAALAQAKGE